MAILDVDDPQVGVELAFARDVLSRIGSVDPLPVMQTREAAHAVIAGLALRRRTENRHTSVETIKNNEDRTGFIGAALSQSRKRAFDCAPAQIG